VKSSPQNTKALHFPWLGKHTLLCELASPLGIHSQPQKLLPPLDFHIGWKKSIEPLQKVPKQQILQIINFS